MTPVPTSGRLARLYAPQWAGPWALARVLYALGCVFAHLLRLPFIEDAYASTDMVFSRPPFQLADHVVFSPATAYGLWAAAVVGAGLLLVGGRLARPGLILWLCASWLLIAAEAFNIKAYDRVITWIGLGLLLGPIGERGLTRKWRSPYGRWFLLVFYAALYGSTGGLKALEDGVWWTGDVLAFHLVDRWFGGSAMGAWVSGQRWLYLPMQWFTVAFELLFPVAVLLRRLNPWWLLAGVAMHLGIWALMNVGPFSFVALTAYPVLLHPEVAHEWWQRACARWPALSRL
ncbi:hypothetical protein L6R53_04330 [Myxococcota bacterium]|nr:hypothetical protein [Myxococcota bacterium]